MSMYHLLEHGHRTRTQPWARLWAEGHGDTWLADADYTRHSISVLRTALTC